jgi:predicted nuclease with TOPRIM domain
VTEPDEALICARLWRCKNLQDLGFPPSLVQSVSEGSTDETLQSFAQGYRAGQAASAERIKALEEENAALEEMAGNLQVRMSDMLERLHERYPEDFVWLKEADQ